MQVSTVKMSCVMNIFNNIPQLFTISYSHMLMYSLNVSMFLIKHIVLSVRGEVVFFFSSSD